LEPFEITTEEYKKYILAAKEIIKQTGVLVCKEFILIHIRNMIDGRSAIFVDAPMKLGIRNINNFF